MTSPIRPIVYSSIINLLSTRLECMCFNRPGGWLLFIRSGRLYFEYTKNEWIALPGGEFGSNVIDNVFASNRNRELVTTKQLITASYRPRAKKATNNFSSRSRHRRGAAAIDKISHIIFFFCRILLSQYCCLITTNGNQQNVRYQYFCKMFWLCYLSGLSLFLLHSNYCETHSGAIISTTLHCTQRPVCLFFLNFNLLLFLLD